MCDQDLADAVDNVLESFTNAKKQFTNWDVTKEVRKTLRNTRHWEVKQEINDLYNCGHFPYNYFRQVVTLKNGEQPFVYSPTDLDPQDYEKVVVPQVTPVVSVTTEEATTSYNAVASADTIIGIIGATSDTIDVDATTGNVLPTTGNVLPATGNVLPPADDLIAYVRADARDRICVPNRFMKQLSVDQGQLVYAKYNTLDTTPKITITDHFPNTISGDRVQTYVVDSSYNVRVTRKTLTNAGFLAGSDRVISLNNDKIVIF